MLKQQLSKDKSIIQVENILKTQPQKGKSTKHASSYQQNDAGFISPISNGSSSHKPPNFMTAMWQSKQGINNQKQQQQQQ